MADRKRPAALPALLSSGGSARAKQMLQLATAAGSARPPRQTPKRPQDQFVSSRAKKSRTLEEGEAWGGVGHEEEGGECTTPDAGAGPSNRTPLPLVPSDAARQRAEYSTPFLRRPVLPACQAGLPFQSRGGGGAAAAPWQGDPTATKLARSYWERQQEQQQRRQAGPLLPAGMRNLGNTCYINAILQARACTACLPGTALLSLPSFLADLRQGWQRLATAVAGQGGGLPAEGVYAALLECVGARDSLARGQTAITPAALKRAVDARSAAFQGTFQQDAHELFCALLDLVQSEVLTVETRQLGRRLVCISETADPAARNFGFAVQHELRCERCGRESRVVEQYMHLSLELPEQQPGAFGASSPAASLNSLLARYFKEEHVQKDCEGCGGSNVGHQLHHRLLRLPRVLALHLKRFKVGWSAERQQAFSQKLHTPIEIAEAVRLGSWLVESGARPPLPLPPQQREKENLQQAANHMEEEKAGAGRAAGADAQQQQQAASGGQHGLNPRGSVRFYDGGGGGGASPAAAHALLSFPLGAPASPALRRRPGTPAVCVDLVGESGLSEEEQLRQVLELSAMEYQQQQPRQQQQQQSPAAVTDCTARGALEAGSAASAEGSAVAAAPDSDLERALAESLRQEQQQQQGEGYAAAAAAGQDPELQRALELSLLEQQLQQQEQEDPLPAWMLRSRRGAMAAAASPPQELPEWEQQGRQHQHQQQGFVGSVLDIVGEAMAQDAEARAGSAAAGPVVVAGDLGGQPASRAGEAGQPDQQPAFLSGQIVEDDADLGPPSASGAGGAGGTAAAAAGGPAGAAAQEVAPAGKRPPAVYRLQAVVNHQGPAASSGHFTADVRDAASGCWFRHNDSLVTRISASEARGGAKQRECYMLLYHMC